VPFFDTLDNKERLFRFKDSTKCKRFARDQDFLIAQASESYWLKRGVWYPKSAEFEGETSVPLSIR
jgi:hypothetical protein